MKVSEYFEARRDAAGRVWLDPPCWIERAGTQFRVRSQSSVVLVSSTDEVEVARFALASSGNTGPGAGPDELVDPPDPDANDQVRYEMEPEVACQFEDWQSGAAWPRVGATDAEQLEFDYSVDVGEEGVFDWDF